MKKILILCLFTFLSINAFARIYDIDYLNNKSESYADDQFEPVAELFTQAINNGISDLMDVETFKAGFQLLVLPFEKEGGLENADSPVLYSPYIYGGISIYDLTLFTRYMYFPYKTGDKNPHMWGFGGSYKLKPTALLTLYPGISYHNSSYLQNMEIHSFGLYLEAIADLTLIRPYANLGTSITYFGTDIKLNNGDDFSYTTFYVHSCIGIKAFDMYYELTLTPKITHNIGYSKNF